MTTEPRIYVADLAAYNSGYLHGVWIDASAEVEDIQQQINAMLAASPVPDAEEPDRELRALYREAFNEAARADLTSQERWNALASLANIRRVMNARGLRPC